MSKVNASLIAIVGLLLSTTGPAFGSHPVIPVALKQLNLDMTPLVAGGTSTGLGVIIQVSSDSATCDSLSKYSAEFEVVPVGAMFTNIPNYQINYDDGMGGQGKANCSELPYPPLTINNLLGGAYKWQVREKVNNATSGWGAFNGGNTAFVLNGADIKVQPAQVQFGNQLVGVASPTQNVLVSSTGMGPLNINSITVTGPFSASGINAPSVLQPGASSNIAISFKPIMPGNAAGTLTISSDAQSGQQTVINLSGIGVTATATLMPGSFDFGQVALGADSLPQQFTLSNSGTGPLVITALTPNGPFSFSNLPMLPLTLQPNGTATFTAIFRPLQVGVAMGGLAVVSNDPKSPTNLVLQGTGTSLGLNSLPNPLAFGQTIIPVMGGQGATKTINLLSNINQPITIQTIGAPTNADFVILNKPNLPLVVPPMGMVTLNIAFNPTMHTLEQAQITVTSDAPNSPLTMLVNGIGVGPTISAAPALVDFGPINVKASGLQILSVKNSGETDLTVKSVMVTGPNAAEFASPTNFPVKVKAGGTQTIALTFAPQAAGARTAMLALINDDPANPALAVKLQGSASVPKIDAQPNPADFGSVLVGSASQPMPITISNAGPGTLTISALAVGGMDAASFRVVAPALPMVIAAGGSRTLSPVFSPTAAGKASAKLTLMSDDPNNTNFDVALTGTGLAAMVSLDPAALDFGAQLVGRASAAKTVNITNNGSAPLNVLSLTMSGPQAGSFMVSMPPALPKKLMPGEKLAVNLVYAPSAAQMDSARLVVGSDDPMSPASNVALTGTGVSTILTASPMMLDFGMIRAPGMSMPKTITITNVGGSPLTLVAPVLGGGAANQYVVDAPLTNMTLMPGGTGTANVTFQPTVKGVAGATLLFKTSDANLPGVSVTLAGVGASPKVLATPATLDFGNVAVGSTSATKTVTLSNTSASAFKIGTITSDNTAFVIADVDTSANIAPGGTTKFTVAFAPTGEGSAKASIKIMLAGAVDVENTIAANGTGKAATAPDMAMGTGMEQSGCTVAHRGNANVPAGAALVLLLAGLVLRRRRAA